LFLIHPDDEDDDDDNADDDEDVSEIISATDS